MSHFATIDVVVHNWIQVNCLSILPVYWFTVKTFYKKINTADGANDRDVITEKCKVDGKRSSTFHEFNLEVAYLYDKL